MPPSKQAAARAAAATASPLRRSLRSQGTAAPPAPRRPRRQPAETPPRPQIPAAAMAGLHPQPLQIPGRSPELPDIYVCSGHHPQNPRPNQRGGFDFVVPLGLGDVQAARALLVHSFERSISRLGKTSAGTHRAIRGGFECDGTNLVLGAQDCLFVRDSGLDGDPAKDVCISFGFELAELGEDVVARARAVRDRLIGPEAEATRKAPSKSTEGSRIVRSGGTALERDHRSHPISGTERAIPVSLSVEMQRGGLHAPTSGNRYTDDKPSLSEQDPGFHLRRDYNEVASELAATGLARFGPKGTYDLVNDLCDLVNAPRIGCSRNPGFTNQQSNQAAPQAREFFEKAENAVRSIEEIGPFGDTHTDHKDLLAGLSFLLSLSNIPCDRDGVHPGLMVLCALGVARRLDPFTGFYMCGVHTHAGTVPTFSTGDEEMDQQFYMRLLSISYMSSYVLGGQGPSALAALTPSTVLQVSREFRDPCGGAVSGGHNSYARDGISVMQPADLANFLGRELLLLVVGTLAQAPSFMDMRVDRRALLAAISFVDEHGVRRQLPDWELGPGHGVDGRDHEIPAGFERTDPPPPFNNYPRDRATSRWKTYAAACERSLQLVTVARASTAEGSDPAKLPLVLGGIAATVKSGKEVYAADARASTSRPKAPQQTARKKPRQLPGQALANAFSKGHIEAVTKMTRAVAAAAKQAGATEPLAGPSTRGKARAGRDADEAPALGTKRAHEISWDDLLPVKRPRGARPRSPSRPTPPLTPPPPPDSDGEEEVVPRDWADARRSGRPKQQRLDAAHRLMNALSLGQLAADLAVVRRRTENALLNKRVSVDVVFNVQELEDAFQELFGNPLSPGAVQACSVAIDMSARMGQHSEFQTLQLAWQRQRAMTARMLSFVWVEKLLLPQLYVDAATVLSSPQLAMPTAASWTLRVVDFLHRNLDGRAKRARSLGLTFAVDATQFVPGSPACKVQAVKHVVGYDGQGSARTEILAQTAARVIMGWSGFDAIERSTHEVFTAAFVHHLVDHIGMGALFLDGVWEAFTRPDHRIVGCPGGAGKLHLEMYELAEWEEILERSPVARADSAERQLLQDIEREYLRIHAHVRMPLPIAPAPKPPAQPDNMLVFLRLALHLVPKHGQLARMPPNPKQFSDHELFFLRHMYDNTDHRLPVRNSAEAIVPLRSASGPLHKDHLRTVAGLYSMGLFRGTTYHSPFARDKNLFDGHDGFMDAVRPLEKRQFALDNCYGGQAQPRRSTNVEEHSQTLWNTVREPSVNYWLLGYGRPRARETERVAAAGKPKYEEVLAIVRGAKHRFPMCGDLAGHLLTADYCDAGIVEPPSVQTMAHAICKIDAGALSGLVALDYMENRSALDYVRQQAFFDLHAHLDQRLTADEKKRLSWGPICLEHALCKYSRMIKVPGVQPLFIRTDFARKYFS